MNDEVLYGLSPSSLFYVAVFAITFLAHFAGVSYVVGGVLYLGWRQLISREANSLNAGISPLVRDWMPFALSVAITLGVAPLLFIQVIYPKEFYTSNLLLGWRWMLIVPALICGFYLLYLIKSKYFERSGRGMRMVILAVTAGCFAFVGASWSSNHVLMQLETSWPHIYFDISTLDTVLPFVLIRMSVWMGCMLMTFPMLMVWQIRWTRDGLGEETRRTVRGLLWCVRSGALLSGLGMGAMFLPMMRAEWRHLDEWLLRRTMESALAAGLLYWVYWETIRVVPLGLGKTRLMTGVWLLGATAAGFAREMNRMGIIDLGRQQSWMENAAGVGGFWLFLIFVGINGLLIRYCLQLAGRAARSSPKE